MDPDGSFRNVGNFQATPAGDIQANNIKSGSTANNTFTTKAIMKTDGNFHALNYGDGSLQYPFALSQIGTRDYCTEIITNPKLRHSFRGKPVGSKLYYKSPSYTKPTAVEKVSDNGLKIMVPPGEGGNRTTTYQDHTHYTCYKDACPFGMKGLGDGSKCTKLGSPYTGQANRPDCALYGNAGAPRCFSNPDIAYTGPFTSHAH